MGSRQSSPGWSVATAQPPLLQAGAAAPWLPAPPLCLGDGSVGLLVPQPVLTISSSCYGCCTCPQWGQWHPKGIVWVSVVPSLPVQVQPLFDTGMGTPGATGSLAPEVQRTKEAAAAYSLRVSGETGAKALDCASGWLGDMLNHHPWVSRFMQSPHWGHSTAQDL